jgi:hypothetical protein
MSASTLPKQPPVPNTGHPQRARVILQFEEQGQFVHEATDGYARIEGDWLLWLPDDQDNWQSWPSRHVICVEWESPVRPPVPE